MRLEIPCGQCGQILVRGEKRIATSRHQFCDNKCYGRWLAHHKSGTNSPYYNRAILPCANCEADVQVHPHRAHRTPFCSQKCMDEWNAQHRSGHQAANWKGGAPKVNCAVCGHATETTHYRLARNKQHFCSRTCKARWASQNTSGANSWHWKGGEIDYYGPNWNTQQREARKRDKYTCQACGKTQKKNGRALDVHHVKPFKTFGYMPEQNDNYLTANELTNLLSLCKVCHKRAEHDKIPIQPYLL